MSTVFSLPILAAILQRVLSASVTVEKELVSSIGKGILVFAAVAPGDTEKEAESLAAKVLKLRLWDDDNGGRVPSPQFSPPSPPSSIPNIISHPRQDMILTFSQWKNNVQDISGEVLCVSQFTLLASTKKGNKPSFHQALAPDEARRLYQHFVSKVQEGYVADRVKDGVFQAMMEVALVNDGPVCSPNSLRPCRDLFG